MANAYQIARTNAIAIAKIARIDYPRTWYDIVAFIQYLLIPVRPSQARL